MYSYIAVIWRHKFNISLNNFAVIPTINNSIENENEIEDQTENVTFSCQAVGEPIPDISWYFNGAMINVSDNSSKYMIMSRSLNITTTENTLTVYNVTSSDVGTYTCNSSNIIGSVTSSRILTVTSKFCTTYIHKIIVATCILKYICIYYAGVAEVIPLNNTTIREGNTIIITCEAFGYFPPTIVWSKADGNLSESVSVSDSVSVPTGYGNVTRVSINLTITSASREDTGVYTCFANNSIGSDESIVNITVQCKFTLFV